MARILAGAATLRLSRGPPYMRILRLRIGRGTKSRDHLISLASLYTKVREIKRINVIRCKLMGTTQTMRAPEIHLSRNI